MTDGRNKNYDVDLWHRRPGVAQEILWSAFNNITYGYDDNHRRRSRKFWSTASTFEENIYGYDANANLTSVDHPAGTSDISYTYDPIDRLDIMTDASGTTDHDYHASGGLLFEDGPWANDRVTYNYNNARLGWTLALQQPAGTWNHTYNYDAAGRLDNLVAGSGTFTYKYFAAGQV